MKSLCILNTVLSKEWFRYKLAFTNESDIKKYNILSDIIKYNILLNFKIKCFVKHYKIQYFVKH